ncbi:hypothetical protein HX037_00075 [Ignatzschineria indica]|uniref:hypothetical protein n=1 Tax=Ignatzschineria indica TaxID=472583 RepID=UPI00257775C2|nr:hypothetical protein [Ignatzschineria indica]MDM1544288.1 hypothetical protein [Ignatzschineria indica]
MKIIITELSDSDIKAQKEQINKHQYTRSQRGVLRRCLLVISSLFTKLRSLWQKRPILIELLGAILLLFLIALLSLVMRYLLIVPLRLSHQALEKDLRATQLEIKRADQSLELLYRWRDLHLLQQKSSVISLIMLLAQIEQHYSQKIYLTDLWQEKRGAPLVLQGRVISFDLMREIEALFVQNGWKITTQMSADQESFRLFTLSLEPHLLYEAGGE